MLGQHHNSSGGNSTVRDKNAFTFFIPLLVTIIGGIITGIVVFLVEDAYHDRFKPQPQPTIVNRIEQTIINKVAAPKITQSQTPAPNQPATGNQPPAPVPSPQKPVFAAPSPSSYFGYTGSDPDQITSISYSGFPAAVTKSRALGSYLGQLHNAVLRTDDRSHIARVLVLYAERHDVSTDDCSLGTEISITYHFEDQHGARTTEERTVKGRPVCLAGNAEQADKEGTENAIAALARVVD